MNYAKLLSGAISLFPKMIKVKLIDAATGHLLHKHKIPAEKLPAAFNKPTILEINGISWRVLKADPVLADDFLFKKRLTLYVQHAIVKNVEQRLFDLPTICDEKLVMGNDSLYNHFTLTLTTGEWRQIEFLSLGQLITIAEEIKAVGSILNKQPNALLGYEQQYKRQTHAHLALNISWKNFYATVSNPLIGNICVGDSGFVHQGFALRSDNYMYYGILQEENIQALCITQFDGVDDELMRVLDTFKLVLTNWCNASTLSAEPGEKPQSEFINI
jgi:hypothetical protein